MKDQRFLSSKGFRGFLKGLINEFTVYGLISKDGFPAFGRISSPEELVLSRTPTHLSAKEFTFPQREVLLRFDLEKKTHEEVVEARDQVVIGLHPCDISALKLMDRVFSYGTSDVNYLARRARTLVIGTDCLPDKYCFCKSLGTMDAQDGFDLFMSAVTGGFIIKTGTERGRGLLKKHAKTAKPASARLKELERRRVERDSAFTASVDAKPSELPSVYSKSHESPEWQRIGAICYGCGSCNHVCPTCYCFDVKDEVTADLKGGERVRTWDGCTLDEFAKVAGGHNFRKARAERLRHRFNRKFNYLTDRFGALFCVGCGRCSRTCLVGINITETTNELIREHKERSK